MAVESLKLDFVEENLIKMLKPILENQEFLRYVKYLNDYPQDLQYTYKDDMGNDIVKDQPDINADLVQDGTIELTFFDPVITTISEVKIFFTLLKSRLDDERNGGQLTEDIYVMDILVPVQNVVVKSSGKLRPIRLANLFVKAIDNQIITGLGRVRVIEQRGYKQNGSYEGRSLFVRVRNMAKVVR